MSDISGACIQRAYSSTPSMMIDKLSGQNNSSPISQCKCAKNSNVIPRRHSTGSIDVSRLSRMTNIKGSRVLDDASSTSESTDSHITSEFSAPINNTSQPKNIDADVKQQLKTLLSKLDSGAGFTQKARDQGVEILKSCPELKEAIEHCEKKLSEGPVNSYAKYRYDSFILLASRTIKRMGEQSIDSKKIIKQVEAILKDTKKSGFDESSHFAGWKATSFDKKLDTISKSLPPEQTSFNGKIANVILECVSSLIPELLGRIDIIDIIDAILRPTSVIHSAMSVNLAKLGQLFDYSSLLIDHEKLILDLIRCIDAFVTDTPSTPKAEIPKAEIPDNDHNKPSVEKPASTGNTYHFHVNVDSHNDSHNTTTVHHAAKGGEQPGATATSTATATATSHKATTDNISPVSDQSLPDEIDTGNAKTPDYEQSINSRLLLASEGIIPAKKTVELKQDISPLAATAKVSVADNFTSLIKVDNQVGVIKAPPLSAKMPPSVASNIDDNVFNPGNVARKIDFFENLGTFQGKSSTTSQRLTNADILTSTTYSKLGTKLIITTAGATQSDRFGVSEKLKYSGVTMSSGSSADSRLRAGLERDESDVWLDDIRPPRFSDSVPLNGHNEISIDEQLDILTEKSNTEISQRPELVQKSESMGNNNRDLGYLSSGTLDTASENSFSFVSEHLYINQSVRNSSGDEGFSNRSLTEGSNDRSGSSSVSKSEKGSDQTEAVKNPPRSGTGETSTLTFMEELNEKLQARRQRDNQQTGAQPSHAAGEIDLISQVQQQANGGNRGSNTLLDVGIEPQIPLTKPTPSNGPVSSNVKSTTNSQGYHWMAPKTVNPESKPIHLSHLNNGEWIPSNNREINQNEYALINGSFTQKGREKMKEVENKFFGQSQKNEV